MIKHLAAATAAALLLSACSGGGEEGNTSSESATGGAAIEQTPENLMDDPNNEVVPLTPVGNAPVPVPAMQATPSPIAAIPEDFRGRWGMVANDCIPARADAKGLITVSADGIALYESRARASDVMRVSPTKVNARLAYSGEGQTWNRDATLTLLDDGKTLVRDEGKAGAFRYSRCPA